MSGVVLLCLISTLGQMNAEFYHDFRTGKNPPPVLAPVRDGQSGTITAERGGFRLSLPEGHPPKEAVGFSPLFRIGGDFQITVTYRLLSTGKPTKGLGAGLKIWAKFASQQFRAATLGHFKQPEGEEAIVAILAEDKKGKRDYKTESVPASTQEGQLRLVRSGDELSFQVSEDGGASFSKLQRTKVGTEDVANLRIVATSGEDPAAVDVQLLELRIKAERLSTAQEPLKKQGGWIVLRVLVVLAIAGAGAFVAWRKMAKPHRTAGT